MYLRKEFEKRIEKKREEIAVLERQLAEARAYLLALEDSMRLVSRVGETDAGNTLALRPGSDLAKAREYLQKIGKKEHVNKIVEGIGKELTKANRLSLGGSLSGYARKGLIFTRPAPNTFGLVEFEENNGGNEPPAEFGGLEEDGELAEEENGKEDKKEA
jgi:hypothetical protein